MVGAVNQVGDDEGRPSCMLGGAGGFREGGQLSKIYTYTARVVVFRYFLLDLRARGGFLDL